MATTELKCGFCGNKSFTISDEDKVKLIESIRLVERVEMTCTFCKEKLVAGQKTEKGKRTKRVLF